MTPDPTLLRTLLAGVPLFHHLEEDQLDRVVGASLLERYPADHIVLDPAETARSLFVVVSGEVQVVYPARSAEVELARLGPGDFFGEMAILNALPRSATVRTVEDAQLLRLDRDAFEELVRGMPELALALLESLSLRIRDADQQISNLSDQALRDSLTGLLNRRAFNERLSEEFDRNQRYGEPFSLVLLDLDDFKSVNDSYGHAVGDQVLAWVGRVISEHTRVADFAYRIGGDEFAIICPSSEGEVAAQAAKRVVDVMAQLRPPLDFDLEVTLSAGYASAPMDARRPDTLFQTGDRALMRAKAEGRNRVCGPTSGF